MDHSFAVTYHMRAQTSMSALFPFGKLPTTRVRRLISRLSRSIMLFVRMRLRCPAGNFIQQVGSRLLDVLAQAVGGRLQPPGLHIGHDGVRLVQRGFPGLHGEHGLQGRRRPFAVAGRHLGEHVAQEVRHAPLVPRLRQHRVHRGDQSRAPVATTRRTPFRPRSIMERGTAPSWRNPPSCPRRRR